ncbi:Dps family protein [Marinicrinis lubricantis]|uniref:Dps family protein n=1 Tax=Marinicrinis lubricantis TaxID=2086470 RepID=A0ABW1IJ38_9BACL
MISTTMDLKTALNKQVANFSVLYVKLHHFHWYVKGTNFFTLHEMFEKYYNEATQSLDDIAERVLTLGGRPLSTMAQYVQESSIKEAAGNESAEQMVTILIDDFSTVVQELRQGIEIAEEHKDEVTGDLLIGIQSKLEKHIWMLKSFNMQ